MFVALKRWLAGGNSKRRIAGLFVFEFVVVLLGVLAAQSLQSAFVSRQNREIADEAVREHRADLADFANYADYHLRAHTCQIAYLRRLRDAAFSGEKPADLPFRPPTEPVVWVAQWDNETRRVVRRYYGQDMLTEHARFELFSSRLQRRRDDAMLDWGVVSLITFPDFADDPAVQSEIQLALARLIAMRVDTRSIASTVDDELQDRNYEIDEEKVGTAMKSLVNCEQAEDDADAKAS